MGSVIFQQFIVFFNRLVHLEICLPDMCACFKFISFLRKFIPTGSALGSRCEANLNMLHMEERCMHLSRDFFLETLESVSCDCLTGHVGMCESTHE